MFTSHRSQNGEVQYIAQMHDQHLINTIRAHLRALEVKRQQLAAMKEAGRTHYDPDAYEAAQELYQMASSLCYYLAEAYLRGLDEPRFLLRHQLGRDQRLEKERWPLLDLVEDFLFPTDDPDDDHGMGWDPIAELDLD